MHSLPSSSSKIAIKTNDFKTFNGFIFQSIFSCWNIHKVALNFLLSDVKSNFVKQNTCCVIFSTVYNQTK